jgi:nucleotide-binding universal stress UspA family protein
VEAPYSKDFSSMGVVNNKDQMDDVFVIKSIEMARKKMKQILNDKKFVGVKINPKIKTGSVFSHLSDLIVSSKIDLIVMGTEGPTGFLKGIFNKTNTEEVVMKANCMVLSLRNNTGDFKLKNLIYASDFKDDSPDFIANLKELQNIFEFTIHITHINSIIEGKEDKEKISKKINAFIKNFRITDYQIHIHEDMTEYTGITSLANKINADIIALATHQRKGFWHWLGGLSEDLVNYSEKPVLTYPVG